MNCFWPGKKLVCWWRRSKIGKKSDVLFAWVNVPLTDLSNYMICFHMLLTFFLKSLNRKLEQISWNFYILNFCLLILHYNLVKFNLIDQICICFENLLLCAFVELFETICLPINVNIKPSKHLQSFISWLSNLIFCIFSPNLSAVHLHIG